jgi:hypothetical protein
VHLGLVPWYDAIGHQPRDVRGLTASSESRLLVGNPQSSMSKSGSKINLALGAKERAGAL